MPANGIFFGISRVLQTSFEIICDKFCENFEKSKKIKFIAEVSVKIFFRLNLSLKSVQALPMRKAIYALKQKLKDKSQ
jgi:hypothetical protein